jgi:hypothetical protein
VRTTNRGDVQRLVARIEYKNLLQRHEFSSQRAALGRRLSALRGFS